MQKDVPNNYRENPLRWYKEKLQGMTADEVSLRCGLEKEGDYVFVTIMGCRYSVQIPDFVFKKLTEDKPDFLAAQGTQVLLLHFLTESNYAPGTGKFISFREYPSGELYYKAFEGRCLKRLAFSYGTKIQAFCEDCEALGARKISGGDAAYEMEFMPGLFIRMIIWGPDEEFPPSAQLLFSDNFPVSLSSEGVAGLGDILISALKNINKNKPQT